MIKHSITSEKLDPEFNNKTTIDSRRPEPHDVSFRVLSVLSPVNITSPSLTRDPWLSVVWMSCSPGRSRTSLVGDTVPRVLEASLEVPARKVHTTPVARLRHRPTRLQQNPKNLFSPLSYTVSFNLVVLVFF